MRLLYDVHSHSYVQQKNVLSIQQLNLSEEIPNTPFSISVHPWDVEHTFSLDKLLMYGNEPNCIAIGETGLDKIRGNFEIQKDIFLKHITIAKQVKKPLILHCVRAYEECMAMLKNEHFTHGVLFHGFNKHPNLAKQILKNGYYISLGASFLKENPNFERFLIESDFKGVLFETDTDVSLDIKTIYQKAQNIHPKLDMKQTITDTFNNWKEK